MAEAFACSNQHGRDGGSQHHGGGSDPTRVLSTQDAAVLILERSPVILLDIEIDSIKFVEMRLHGGPFLSI
jgi:hypothetical protein